MRPFYFRLKNISSFSERKMRPRRRPLVPTLTYLSRTKICASGKICSVAPLPTKGLPFAGSLNTQAACFRVSSSCTLYEVFGNFAWRSAPPRKRVTQSEKAPALRDREVPPRKRRRGARLRGNGDRGTCLTEGEALLRRSAGYIFIPFQEIPRQARNDNKLSRKSACIFSACADDEWECEGNPHTPFILRLRTYTATRRRRISLQSNFITK